MVVGEHGNSTYQSQQDQEPKNRQANEQNGACFASIHTRTVAG